jgi:hypothetical protein
MNLNDTLPNTQNIEIQSWQETMFHENGVRIIMDILKL